MSENCKLPFLDTKISSFDLQNLEKKGFFRSIFMELLKADKIKNVIPNQLQINQTKEELGLNDNPNSYETNNGSWKFTTSINQAVDGADAIVILTDWNEFYNLNFESLYKTMRSPSWIFDTRNVVNVTAAKLYGFKVWKLGDGSTN